MSLFCHFTRLIDGGEEVCCFLGVKDKVVEVSCRTTDKKVASREFLFDAQGSSLICLTMSVDNSYLCGAYTDKRLVAWDVSTGDIVGQTVVHKKPTAVVCSSMVTGGEEEAALQSNFVLVSEKGGEVWACPLPSLSRSCKLIGHTSSVITDMVLSPDGKRIVTSDRDEKIRLTKFPESATIFGYCLGHTDVVTSVAFLSTPNPLLLVSTGWDHRICLWDTTECELLDTVTISSSISSVSKDNDNEKDDGGGEKIYDETKAGHFPLRVVTGFEGYAAVLVWNKPEINIYRVSCKAKEVAKFLRENDGSVSCTVISLPAVPMDCFFVKNGTIVVLLPAPYFIMTMTLAGEEADEEIWLSISKRYSEICTENGMILVCFFVIQFFSL